MRSTKTLSHAGMTGLIGVAGLLLFTAPAQAKVICTLKKGNTTVQISTGHNDPSQTYRQINGGGWSKVSGTAAQNCAKYRARGYK